MGSGNLKVIWRIGYAICSLIYMVWMGHLSINNFDMVHREYRRVAKNLQPARIEEIALRELVDQCRRGSGYAEHLPSADGTSASTVEDPCLSWAPADLEERQQTVKERLVKERSRVRHKLVWFYVTFGFFFLLLPPVFLYLLLSFFFWIFKNVKIVE